MESDPRYKLSKSLSEIGLESGIANLIAVEGGSSQAIVNRIYLAELGITDKLQVKVFEEVVKFYMGEYSDYLGFSKS